MRRLLLLLVLAACGPKPAPVVQPPPPREEPPPVDALPPMVMVVTPHGRALVVVACQGDVEGVGGGNTCAHDLTSGGVDVEGCTDARGAVRARASAAEDAVPLQLVGGIPERTPPTDPRDKREHAIDLDGDGTPETITLIPHDNRASYGRSLSIVDGHDPLMSDTYDPFPDAADLQVLGTSDVDHDGRREVILYAPDEEGFGIAVQEYWAPAEAYRLDCRGR